MADKKVSSVTAKPVSANNQGQQPVTNQSPNNRAAASNRASHSFQLFGKDNYIWMIAGLVIIAIGMFLMSGGKSNNPAVFDQKEVYSTTRITIAPLLIIIGLGLEVFAIFRKPRK